MKNIGPRLSVLAMAYALRSERFCPVGRAIARTRQLLRKANRRQGRAHA